MRGSRSGARARGRLPRPDASRRDGSTVLWRASPPRPSHPVVYLPGLGPQATGRTAAERLLQRVEVLPLSRTFEVWLVAWRVPVPPGSTIARLAEEHARAIRQCFDRPVDVIGESTGGSIALQLAIDHPEVVDRLVLVSAAARMRRRGRGAQRAAAESVRADHPRRAAATILGTTTRDRLLGRMLRAAGWLLGRLAIGRSDRELVRLIEAEDGFDAGRDLGRVTAPTLLIGGGRDGYYTPDLLERTAAGIPRAVHVDLPRKGHLSAMLDRSVRRAIRDHLLAGGPAPRR